MDSGILNIRTGLIVNDRVLVTERHTNVSFEGVVVYTEVAPINAAFPNGNSTEYIYVKFDDLSAYQTWLKRGSPLIVMKESRSLDKCVVREIIIEDEKMKELVVANEYRVIKPINIFNREYKIGPNEIDSMLVWRVAYNLQRI